MKSLEPIELKKPEVYIRLDATTQRRIRWLECLIKELHQCKEIFPTTLHIWNEHYVQLDKALQTKWGRCNTGFTLNGVLLNPY